MTIYLVTSIHWYVGLSTDVKPTASVPPGSRFFAFDTPAWYVFDGDSWQVQP